MRKWILLWMASLITVAALTSVMMRAQTREEPRILSGADLGFRVESTSPAGDAVGTWVVRLNGRWVTASSKMSIQRQTQ
ncbi:MAG: hypothetical protein ABI024_08750 [Vicinamibacterales bacterium]